MSSSLFTTHALLALDRLTEARDELAVARASYWGANTTSALGVADVLITRAEGDLAAAERILHDALVEQHEIGWRPLVVHSLEALAGLAAAQESFTECARISGAAQQMRDDMGYVQRWPYEQRLYEGDLAAARAALGADAFDAAFAEGMTLDEDAVVAYVERARGERKRPSAGWQSLTPTESEIVRLAASGLTNREIAEKLIMGAETVKTHLSHIYDKLGVRSRAALATEFAARNAAAQ
jgi:DNA-binding CsgD family transcriptional regulator